MRVAKPGPISSRTWTPLTALNGAVAFGLEIALLAALGVWGFRTGPGMVGGVLLAVGAPLAAAAVWGVFLAAGGPRVPLPVGAEIALKLAVLLTGALAQYATGHSILAVVMAALIVLSVAGEYVRV